MKLSITARVLALAAFIVALYGCDSKNVVTPSDKTGSSAAARADKKGTG